jgi:glycosyltransferase involved in cell wall biosynthesis
VKSNIRAAFDARHLTSIVLRGMDRYTVGLIGELVNRGVQVTLFHRAREPLNPDHIKDLGCHVVGLDDYSGLHWEQVVVPIALMQGKYDLYHAPAERGVPLLAPCPVIFTIHSLTGESYYSLVKSRQLPGEVSDYLGFNYRPHSLSFWTYLFRLQVIRANHILCPSDFCKKEILMFLKANPDRVTTTHLAAHKQFEKPQCSSETHRIAILQSMGINKPYILYVGGYESHKNVIGLLETFSIIKQTFPNLILVTVGSKSIPEGLKQKALQLNFDFRDIVMLVDIKDELTELYDSCELFISLSWRETFCLPALEAMKRGIPVVGSKLGAFAEIAGLAGRIVDPCNCLEAATTIIDLLSGKEREFLSELAIIRAKEFTWDKTVAETLIVYNKYISQ